MLKTRSLPAFCEHKGSEFSYDVSAGDKQGGHRPRRAIRRCAFTPLQLAVRASEVSWSTSNRALI
jgi:hypothetical protein